MPWLVARGSENPRNQFEAARKRSEVAIEAVAQESGIVTIGCHRPRHGNCLFVCTYNCRTIASEQDFRALLYRSRNIKYDVIALQETKARTETIRRTDHNELLIIGAKVDRKNIGGVGFLVNSTVHHLVDSYKIISPRVAVLLLETKDQGTISIINGYAPTSAATDEEKEEAVRKDCQRREELLQSCCWGL
ncbi:unnamed protein product [Heligmosomoides polygyrus]|uniref:Endo/exonuclease/phosphatase domain-containing protein n=1 Tax=Heligmosomoides polygyrus TaxID=6339 RepID=A0A183GC22_HELPZ|nr:unnamed protein product [Heligmosomoides polygyrus]